MICPLCGWHITPTWSKQFECWVAMCLHWVCYAKDKNRAVLGWHDMCRKATNHPEIKAKIT